MARIKEDTRYKRHRRIRLRMSGTGERPRLVIHRSLNNFSAQIIDDAANKLLFALSTFDKGLKAKFPKQAGNLKNTELFGSLFAQKAKEKGFSKIIFDRAGYLYHGRVKAFADALRKGGMEF